MTKDTAEADLPQARELARVAADCDGEQALSEQTRIDLDRATRGDLSRPGATVVHLVTRADDETVAGYAHAERADDASRWSAELVVDPAHRRRGAGTALIHALRALAARDEGEFAVWAHGDLPVARAFAEALGGRVTRELVAMWRPVDDEHPVPPLSIPAGFTLRALTPDDDRELLRVNAAAFAAHPEQRHMSGSDIADRRGSDWFDQAGVLGLFDERTGALAAFHWTKLDPQEREHGEVYVVGVDPAFQGRGLGKVATIMGLAHLVGAGAQRITLYVEGDNAPALATYRRLGFTEAFRDVQWSPAG